MNIATRPGKLAPGPRTTFAYPFFEVTCRGALLGVRSAIHRCVRRADIPPSAHVRRMRTQ